MKVLQNNIIASVGYAILTVTAIVSLSSSVFASDVRMLAVGESTSIFLNIAAENAKISDPEICTAVLSRDRKEILISAKKIGTAKIGALRDGRAFEEFTVNVVDARLKEALRDVSDRFSRMKGVEVEIRNGRVELAGEVSEPDDYRDIKTFATSENKIKNNVRLTDDVIGKIADAIKNELGQSAITVRSVKDKISLEGIALNQKEAERALEIAKLYYPDVLSFISVGPAPRNVSQGKLIELEFHMMEVKKSALRQFGINWAPGAMSGSGQGSSAGEGVLSSFADLGKSLLGFVFQLVPKIRFISERGDGRVLENPSVVVKSGERARIFSGSEIPYYQGDEVSFKKIGIDIDAEPILVDGAVDMRLTATLSAPSADIRGALDTNTVSTTATCPIGESLVLANVVRHGDVKMKNRVPSGVDTSSALFTLFLSKDFQSNRSEFVIFVTPKLVSESAFGRAPLAQFEKTKAAVIKDRSKKEYAEYVSSGEGVLPQQKRSFKKRNYERFK